MLVLVRFYIAVEDGSAQVERDLGVLAGEGTAYKGEKEICMMICWCLKVAQKFAPTMCASLAT